LKFGENSLAQETLSELDKFFLWVLVPWLTSPSVFFFFWVKIFQMATLAQISGENNPFFSKKEFAKLLPILGSVSPQV
jgi:hypothetical protein